MRVRLDPATSRVFVRCSVCSREESLARHAIETERERLVTEGWRGTVSLRCPSCTAARASADAVTNRLLLISRRSTGAEHDAAVSLLRERGAL